MKRLISLSAIIFCSIFTISAQENNTNDSVYSFVDKQAEFTGGEKELVRWVNQHINYPFFAMENGIQGKVLVKFTIEKDGSISDITVVKSVHKSLDDEAIRLVKLMPKWQPATNNEEVVRSNFTMPFTFVLKDGSTKTDKKRKNKR